jgi:hypothetical protein
MVSKGWLSIRQCRYLTASRSHRLVHQASVGNLHLAQQPLQIRLSVPVTMVQISLPFLLVVPGRDVLPPLVLIPEIDLGGPHRPWAKESSKAISTVLIRSSSLYSTNRFLHLSTNDFGHLPSAVHNVIPCNLSSVSPYHRPILCILSANVSYLTMEKQSKKESTVSPRHIFTIFFSHCQCTLQV